MNSILNLNGEPSARVAKNVHSPRPAHSVVQIREWCSELIKLRRAWLYGYSLLKVVARLSEPHI